ncbi:hypothetical protein NDU88_005826 [Pleurodeles waltl]|uniref:Uncharacterized protein n=1 Tax=Pleurodeles waltl TaxID=8319 RepID=A0AAV7QGB5_PLEWA|nr:hypothetical protein NDU88_005826 [Pleurodeles waltl]
MRSSQSDKALVMSTFLESHFGTRREGIVPIKHEVAADVKDIHRDLSELGQRVDSLETINSCSQELEEHRQELLHLQDKNLEPHFQLEDLENRSRNPILWCQRNEQPPPSDEETCPQTLSKINPYRTGGTASPITGTRQGLLIVTSECWEAIQLTLV